MFESITSFTVDHTDMEPGVYERDLKNNIKTWDLRFKRPNKGEYLSPEVLHTLEHFLATYFKNVMKDTVYYFGPMGCQTGFYLLTESHVSKRTVLVGLLGAHAYVMSTEEIPGATLEACGQAALQDLEGARKEFDKFYSEVLINAELEVCKDLLGPWRGVLEND